MEGGGKDADLILLVDFQPLGQVSFGHGLCQIDAPFYGAGDRPGDQQCYQDNAGCADQGDDSHRCFQRTDGAKGLRLIDFRNQRPSRVTDLHRCIGE